MKQIFKIIILLIVLLAGGVQISQAVENNSPNNYEEFLGITNKFIDQVEDKNIKDNKQNKTEVIVFVRDGCHVCHNEEKFLDENSEIKNKFEVTLLNIGEKENQQKWEQLVAKHKLSKVTPITLVGGEVLVGFSEKTTGEKILNKNINHKKYGLDYYLKDSQQSADEGYTCQVDTSSSCSLEPTNSDNKNTVGKINTTTKQNLLMTLPFFGEINVKEASLMAMSSILGFIDGFNPCAMWVLLTFLIILSQIGDRQKMVYLAGLFIVAEGIMYFLILNVWYQTWDFIKLDQITTPIIGLIAVGVGGYFLYKYYKNRGGKIACEVTSLEHQQKTVAKIKEVVSKPITIITTLAVLGLAFSVNIIEFACSVGIAQSFTKILELNELNFLMRQWYIFIYSLFYMADDILIFALAIFGYQKFASVGAKYSHLSSLLGGLLMIILGLLLIFRPDLLAG